MRDYKKEINNSIILVIIGIIVQSISFGIGIGSYLMLKYKK